MGTFNVATYVLVLTVVNNIKRKDNKMSADIKNTTQTDREVWVVDEAHSKVQFSVRHMVISEVTGLFRNFDLKLYTNNNDFEQADIKFVIEAASLDTGIADRDNHLRSDDFFGVEKFGNIAFKSRSIKKVDDEKYKLTGDLTIRDVTREIELDVNYGGQVVDPWGNTRAGFKVQGSINRFDYNLKWNNLIETGGAVVGKTVNITCDIEVVKTQAN